MVRAATIKCHSGPDRRRWFWIAIYAIYIVFILISVTAFYAEQSINTRSSGFHQYVLTFTDDNKEIDHYTVELVNSSNSGRIQAEYDAYRNHLKVRTQNIRKLTIDCRSLAQEKSEEILGFTYENNLNEYKQYFIRKNLLTVVVYSDNVIKLALEDVPYPTRVVVDGETWDEGLDEEYIYSDGLIVTTVKEGKTIVDIYFQETVSDLKAVFRTNRSDFKFLPGEDISFDASLSEGEIKDYLWDFSDGVYGNGVIVHHT